MTEARIAPAKSLIDWFANTPAFTFPDGVGVMRGTDFINLA